MALAEGFGQFTARLSKMERALSGDGLRELTNRVALDAKKDAMGELVSDLGGDKKFHNWKPRLGVGYELTSDHEAEVKPRPQGPWKVLDHGRWPGSKYSRKARRQVSWGPTKGRGTWDRSVRDIEEHTPRRVRIELAKIIEGIFQ